MFAAGAVPGLLWAISCGGDDAPADANNQTSFQVTSDSDATGHRHVLTVMCGDLAGGDVRYTSSESAQHTHMVTMTRDELGRIAAGETVTKTITDAHAHTWTIMRPSTAC